MFPIGLLLLSGPVLAEILPHASYDKLVTANGHAVAVFDGDNANGPVMDVFSDHMYQQWAEGSEPTRDLLWDTYFGMQDGSFSGWLTASSSYDYENGTGIVAVDRGRGDIAMTEYAFAPMSLPRPALVHLLQVRNDGAVTLTGLDLFSLHNFHVGDSDGMGNYNVREALWAEGGWLVEQGTTSGLGLLYIPLTDVGRLGCDQVWNTVNMGSDLDGACGDSLQPIQGDDRVGALQWTLDLDPGQEAWVGLLEVFFQGSDPSVRNDAAIWIADRAPSAILDDERTGWSTWIGQGVEPVGLTADEQAVYRQSLAFLRMAQVQEPYDPHGQVLASLSASSSDEFSHVWNIAWVRDGAYAIQALTAAGHYEEARDALVFLLQDQAGLYAHLVGRDYSVSVCRCFGNGDEWSDWNDDGPNVEYDNFGLLLWALGGYVRASGDTSILAENEAAIFGGLADVLLSLQDAEGLIAADSSIWERHWDGEQKHFTYSSTWAVRGLAEAADLADAFGKPALYKDYAAASASVRAAICDKLVTPEGWLVGNLEEWQAGSNYADLAAVDAFNNGTLDAGGPEGLASIAWWDEALDVASGHGYARNDDGDSYDFQEWIMVDLRMAQARRRACQTTEADALDAWITDLAVANHWTLPELLDPDTADYEGPAPMIGFGAGMYVLGLHDRDDAQADCADGVGVTCEGDADTDSDADTDTDTDADADADGDADADADGDADGDTDLPADSGAGTKEDGCDGCASSGRHGPLAALLGLLVGLLRRSPRGREYTRVPL